MLLGYKRNVVNQSHKNHYSISSTHVSKMDTFPKVVTQSYTSIPDNYHHELSGEIILFRFKYSSCELCRTEQNSLSKPQQASFRKIIEHLIIFSYFKSTLVSKCFSQNSRLYACFVDFSNAFDSVWREGRLSKLNNLGIGRNFYQQ